MIPHEDNIFNKLIILTDKHIRTWGNPYQYDWPVKIKMIPLQYPRSALKTAAAGRDPPAVRGPRSPAVCPSRVAPWRRAPDWAAACAARWGYASEPTAAVWTRPPSGRPSAARAGPCRRRGSRTCGPSPARSLCPSAGAGQRATQLNATQRDATRLDATRRDATRRDATQRNATQHNATRRNSKC